VLDNKDAVFCMERVIIYWWLFNCDIKMN